MNKHYYIKVKDLMDYYNLDLPRPNLKIISVTVPLWSDLNVIKSD